MSSPVIDRLNVALKGRYRVENEIGEGGMATVYLAEDLKHERQVALKVLKPELAAVVGADRFLAEIKTTANLQHPHILPLHDSGEADGFLFYVMPYVEGESLRDRLSREKQLPVAEAVRLTTDVAEALHTAHDAGVIHRDVKPANILMSRGRPLVADFGIALAVSAAGGGRLTETGLSMGTPYYMSPEQASADRDPSPSSDVYSLGCVLYEMLVGEPPYGGGTAQAVLARILTEDPRAPTQIRASIPPNVDAAVRKALEKLPADRFASAEEFARALADPGFRYGEAAVAAAESNGRWKTVAAVLGGLFLFSSGLAAWPLLRPEAAPRVERFALDLELGEIPDLMPDGSGVVYVGLAADGGGQEQLWLRRWDNLDPIPVPGTGGIDLHAPQLSPDGREVAYVDAGALKVTPLDGGLVRTLEEGSGSCCLRWGHDGAIYHQDEGLSSIRRFSLDGSEIEVVATVDASAGEQMGDFQLLPGGEAGVYHVWDASGDPRIEAIRIGSDERVVLTPGVRPYLAPGGHLLFGSLDGRVLAAPFDADALELTGAPVPLVEGVFVSNAYVNYTASPSGSIVYLAGVPGGGGQELVWMSRTGQPTVLDPGHTVSLPTNYGIRLSPDGTRAVYNSLVDGGNDIRVKSLPDGPEERITFSEDDDHRPFWTPDGRFVTYFSGPAPDAFDVWRRRADGTGDRELVVDAETSVAQGSWSPDGTTLILRVAATAGMGIGLRDVLSFRPGIDSVPQPLVATPDFVEGSPSLSPDGGWLVYTSNATGRDEVYVRPYPNVDSTRIRVSTDGGAAPVWSKDGTEIFFVDPARQMIATGFDGSVGRVGGEEVLFAIPAGYPANSANSFYDVSADGQRFLMARPYAGDGEEAAPPRFVLIQNYAAELGGG